MFREFIGKIKKSTGNHYEYHVVLKPITVLLILFSISFFLTLNGFFTFFYIRDIVSCEIEYDNRARGTYRIQVLPEHCKGRILTDKKTFQSYIKQPITLYYRLENFFVGHILFQKSYSLDQLNGHASTDRAAVKSCEPWIENDKHQIYLPCGLVSRSVFTDTFKLYKEDGTPVAISESLEDLVWPLNKTSILKHPQLTEEQKEHFDDWLDRDIFPGGISNPHFQVWTKLAGVPNFSKPYATIKEDLIFPFYVEVVDRYDTSNGSFKKKIIIMQKTHLGGRNMYIPYGYIATGVITFLIFLFMYFKNGKNPRSLGDIRFLKTKSSQKEAIAIS